jgi:predicted deacetylase
MKNKLNISIDDVSPHPRSSTAVLKQCYKIIEEFPEAKFTLFVPAAYWRTQGPTSTSTALNIDQFPDFCAELKGLPKSNFEIGYHGLHHGIPGKSNNDELQHVGLQEAFKIIEMMKEVVSKAGLSKVFKPILRPPAWRMSPDAFLAAITHGIKTFALSPDPYALETYGGIEKQVKHVMYDCCPPLKPLLLKETMELVYHACDWDVNAMTPALTQELLEFLRLYRDEIEFCFIEELV